HSHPDIAARILSLFDNYKDGSTVCELGCGSGWVCHRLAERGFDTVGVDLSESGIQTARREGIKGARFIRDAIDSGLPGRMGLAGQCDVVLSNDVIEHLYRPADLIEAARGLLKPGGVMIRICK
ncbi:MAG: class I SAM-dependent methyltransferase, partial [Candidatus Zixiibacteriota bacterium]